MHEAGLASAVADALRREGVATLDGPRVRLLVTGGHAEPDDFDAAFRLHLASVAPELAGADIEIVHLPRERLCASCGESFVAVTSAEPCPRCGGGGLPLPTPETVEIELERPGAVVT